MARFVVVGLAVVVATTPTQAVDPESKNAAEVLHAFGQHWNEDAWTGGRRAYIRSADDVNWMIRLQAMQQLSRQGQSSVPSLLSSLSEADEPTRILAAQSLGFLGAKLPQNEIVQRIRAEESAAVRLYLVDALGMSGMNPASAQALELWRKTESNGDVRKHIGYALSRGDEPISTESLQSLKEFNMTELNTAQVGRMAPDFVLKSVDGKQFRLRDFRNKGPVVLVFIYGDT